MRAAKSNALVSVLIVVGLLAEEFTPWDMPWRWRLTLLMAWTGAAGWVLRQLGAKRLAEVAVIELGTDLHR